jgi:hypothetical protein
MQLNGQKRNQKISPAIHTPLKIAATPKNKKDSKNAANKKCSK